jgi:hypothetical protein
MHLGLGTQFSADSRARASKFQTHIFLGQGKKTAGESIGRTGCRAWEGLGGQRKKEKGTKRQHTDMPATPGLP